jgi:hypothetical protein
MSNLTLVALQNQHGTRLMESSEAVLRRVHIPRTAETNAIAAAQRIVANA